MDMLKWNKRERQVETLSLKNMLDEIFAGLLSFTEDAGADCASAQ